jgi:hypothetical protein
VTESSRTGPHGAVFPHMSGHKMRYMAKLGLGEVNAPQRAMAQIERLFETKEETDRPDPHVVLVDDVTRGLGLAQTDEQKIQQYVQTVRADMDERTGYQRLANARSGLISAMKPMDQRIPTDTRQEVVRRAVTWWKKTGNTENTKVPTLQFTVSKSLAQAELPVDAWQILDALFPMRKSLTGFDPVEAIEELLKAKYIRRIATGNPKRPWRYVYTRELSPDEQRRAQAWEEVRAAQRKDGERTHDEKGARQLVLGEAVMALSASVLADALQFVRGKHPKVAAALAHAIAQKQGHAGESTELDAKGVAASLAHSVPAGWAVEENKGARRPTVTITGPGGEKFELNQVMTGLWGWGSRAPKAEAGAGTVMRIVAGMNKRAAQDRAERDAAASKRAKERARELVRVGRANAKQLAKEAAEAAASSAMTLHSVGPGHHVTVDGKTYLVTNTVGGGKGNAGRMQSLTLTIKPVGGGREVQLFVPAFDANEPGEASPRIVDGRDVRPVRSVTRAEKPTSGPSGPSGEKVASVHGVIDKILARDRINPYHFTDAKSEIAKIGDAVHAMPLADKQAFVRALANDVMPKLTAAEAAARASGRQDIENTARGLRTELATLGREIRDRASTPAEQPLPGFGEDLSRYSDAELRSFKDRIATRYSTEPLHRETSRKIDAILTERARAKDAEVEAVKREHGITEKDVAEDRRAATAELHQTQLSDRWAKLARETGLRIVEGEGGYTSIVVEGTLAQKRALIEKLRAIYEKEPGDRTSVTRAIKRLEAMIRIVEADDAHRAARAQAAEPAPSPAAAELPPAPAVKHTHVMVGGDTYANRHIIKEHGGRWDKARQQWRVAADQVEKLRARLPDHHHDEVAGEITIGKKKIDEPKTEAQSIVAEVAQDIASAVKEEPIANVGNPEPGTTSGPSGPSGEAAATPAAAQAVEATLPAAVLRAQATDASEAAFTATGAARLRRRTRAPRRLPAQPVTPCARGSTRRGRRSTATRPSGRRAGWRSAAARRRAAGRNPTA